MSTTELRVHRVSIRNWDRPNMIAFHDIEARDQKDAIAKCLVLWPHLERDPHGRADLVRKS